MALSKTTNNVTLALITFPTKLAIKANIAERAVIDINKETPQSKDAKTRGGKRCVKRTTDRKKKGEKKERPSIISVL